MNVVSKINGKFKRKTVMVLKQQQQFDSLEKHTSKAAIEKMKEIPYQIRYKRMLGEKDE